VEDLTVGTCSPAGEGIACESGKFDSCVKGEGTDSALGACALGAHVVEGAAVVVAVALADDCTAAAAPVAAAVGVYVAVADPPSRPGGIKVVKELPPSKEIGY